MCHLDHHRKIPTEFIGCVIWILILLEAARTPTNRTKTPNPIIEYGETHIGGSKKEHEIDFRVPGLSHAVVKEAEHLRVQELVKRIENHPHREALHADLQQKNIYNPFSNNSIAMIRESGNVELFELCETTKGTKFSLSSLLESRNCVLQLRTNA